MIYSKIQPFIRHGVWITLHDRYGQAAFNALNELAKDEAEYVQKEENLKADGEDPNVVAHLMMKERDHLEWLSLTVEILCCMSLEAFLNFYGVVRLGEDFYRRNYERLGITQKTEALLATCQDVLLPSQAEITRVVRRMFERRNSLVHPKSKDITDNVHE